MHMKSLKDTLHDYKVSLDKLKVSLTLTLDTAVV